MTAPSALPTRALPPRTLRHTDLATLIPALESARAHAVDLVMPVGELEFVGGNLAISGRPMELTDEGFYEVNGLYRPVPSVDGQLDSILGIPAKYIRKLREENVGLLDTNLNDLVSMVATANPNQKQLVRMLWGEDSANPGFTGVVRAILSNGFRIQDNLDTVLAILSGLREAGLGPSSIKSIDLSNDRLYMSIESPAVATKATELLKGYRDPRTGTTSREVGDIVSAGMVISNGEIGNGAFSITPVIWALVCTNGMVQKVDVRSRRHVGGRLEEGLIDWSDDTRKKANEFVAAQVRDATATFLSEQYVDEAIARMEADAGIQLSKPVETIEVVAKELGFTTAEKDEILAAFIGGGSTTTGAVMHAVTAAVQNFESPERAFEVGAQGIDAMKAARRFQEKISA